MICLKWDCKCAGPALFQICEWENATRPKNASELAPDYSMQSQKYQTDPPNTHLKFGMLLVTIMFHTYQVRYQHLYQLTSPAP